MKQDIKKRAIRRLKIIAGQLKGLEKMIGGEEYCIDIINQSSAVRAALSGIDDLMLENHISTHVAEQMRSGKEAKATKEILAVYKVAKRK